MGWLWNVENVGISQIRRGWRPGAVSKRVAQMMAYFLGKECDEPAEGKDSAKAMNEKPTSTLKVEKKSGEFRITLNQLCDESGCGDAPVVFKITKTEDEKKRSDAISLLKSRGFNKTCDCNDLCECSCINDCQRQIMLYELKAISDVLCINPTLKYEELNEASECSEIDFEFTPPFEMMNKCRRDVRVSVAATQYEQQSFEEEAAEESSENEVVETKRKIKKKVKKSGKGKNEKKIQKSSNVR